MPPGDHFDQFRLPVAGHTGNTYNFTGPYLKRNVVQHRKTVVISSLQVVNTQHHIFRLANTFVDF